MSEISRSNLSAVSLDVAYILIAMDSYAPKHVVADEVKKQRSLR